MAPERVFGPSAGEEQAYRASGAFFVLGNGLFVSLAALLPELNLGNVLVLAGLAGLLNTLGRLIRLLQGRRRLGVRGAVLGLGGFAIYGGELWLGIALLHRPDQPGVVYGVTYLLLGGYVIGLMRAWDLVSGGEQGLVQTVLGELRSSPPPPADPVSRLAGTAVEGPEQREG